jgi:hypothetical protein
MRQSLSAADPSGFCRFTRLGLAFFVGVNPMKDRFSFDLIQNEKIWDDCDAPSRRDLLEMAHSLSELGFFRACGAIVRQTIELSLWQWYAARVALTGEAADPHLAGPVFRANRIRATIQALSGSGAIDGRFQARVESAVDTGNKACHALPISRGDISFALNVAQDVFKAASEAERSAKGWIVTRRNVHPAILAAMNGEVAADYSELCYVAFA